jgi:TnpA family transposase
VNDQHATFGTKVIVATDRQAHYVLDEILGNATDLPITEHATDSHEVTLVNFALFDLVGLQLSPRIRDLDKITMYRTGSKADFIRAYPHTGPLLTRRLDTHLIAEHWDDLLGLAGSLKFGHASASLIVGKLSRSARQQNALAAAVIAASRPPHRVSRVGQARSDRGTLSSLSQEHALHALVEDYLGDLSHANRSSHTQRA